MKKHMKYIGLFMACMLASTLAEAAKTCNGGVEVTAHTTATNSKCQKSGVNYCNGKTFCVSNRMMNWWSAILWCRSNGRELVALEEACPNWSTENNTCPNLAGKLPDYGWTSKISGNKAVSVEASAFSWPRDTSVRPLALCE